MITSRLVREKGEMMPTLHKALGMTRSFIIYGRPFPGYVAVSDRNDEQEQKIGQWNVDLYVFSNSDLEQIF